MAKKQMLFKTKGMNQDLSVSAFNPEFAFENRNLRLSTNESNTMLSWVNEKGTSIITLHKEGSDDPTLNGIPIGTAILNQTLVVFTTNNTFEDKQTNTTGDCIYKLYFSNVDKTQMQVEELFTGNLNFSVLHPLETLVNYESESIQKVYWTDNRNQPRVINIADTNPGYTNDSFDFVPTLSLNETVKVKKLLGNGGMFAPGVIQYAFTYYKKYGQETNIFYTTPLYYISYADRGASPEDKVDNSFKITINNIDTKFDFLRIYSIQRTSINATPFVKRIQDIDIRNLDSNVNSVSYTDNGTSGDTVDPTELLYKGGESIKAGTIEQKDGTLFLGGLIISRPSLQSEEFNISTTLKNNIGITCETEKRYFLGDVATGNYAYNNQLTLYTYDRDNSLPCSGFKRGDYYRLGIQFQYKTGRWSEPFFIKDKEQTLQPKIENNCLNVPIFEGSLSEDIASNLIILGYKKVRGVVVYPEMADRIVKCQGVVDSTLFTTDTNKYQSSWFFRPYISVYTEDVVTVSPARPSKEEKYLEYTDWNVTGSNPYNPSNIRRVEIQGQYDPDKKFQLSNNVLTMHSPDVEFDDQLATMDFTGLTCNKVGYVQFEKTMSDISIQTESPTISNNGSGFIHKMFNKDSSYGIVSGLFYDDYYVDDLADGTFGVYDQMRASVKWMVYPWQQTGSLNNDINRPADKGTPSAVLKKKVISNLRFASTHYEDLENLPLSNYPQLFSSDEVTILKISNTDSTKDNSLLYQGNVDTLLAPDHGDGRYHANAGLVYNDGWNWQNIDTTFEDNSNWTKIFYKEENKPEDRGWYKFLSEVPGMPDGWYYDSNQGHIGNMYEDLAVLKSSVRMKYKSTPHLLFRLSSDISAPTTPSNTYGKLNVVEIVGKYNQNEIFGGQTTDALRENIWIPCGEPVRLNDYKGKPAYWHKEGEDNIYGPYTDEFAQTLPKDDEGEPPYSGIDEAEVDGWYWTASTLHIEFHYSYGDTYYQRWDCLKTYAFTPEDINQVVEIGSFMLETHVNIDGRYDRNRGQQSNLNMSPINFNLINHVYSQQNNFFTYKIMDESYYRDTIFPNQITWSKTKSAGADVDQWTNITLASTLDLDGDKGSISKLIRFNDQLLCFQDRGLSQILYNENVQVSSTTGVPIEIANSGKVDGKRYLSDTVGCSNKWSIVSGAAGIYFMDNHEQSIYMFNGQLNNLSTKLGFNTWCKKNITNKIWKPSPFTGFVSYYDKKNQEVLFINNTEALAYSEKFGVFTSFYDYGSVPFFCNLDDTGVWIKNGTDTATLWKHQAGDYCSFFGNERPYWMTLVGNLEPQIDKIFTNLEFRACVDGDGIPSVEKDADGNPVKFTPSLPFTHLETWNEYQHGYTQLSYKNGHSAMVHHTSDMDSSLKRKFRIWRCDIPRNNCLLDNDPNRGNPFYDTDAELGISRYTRKSQDRMRNPWLYLKLKQDAINVDGKTEIHDVMLTYFS